MSKKSYTTRKSVSFSEIRMKSFHFSILDLLLLLMDVHNFQTIQYVEEKAFFGIIKVLQGFESGSALHQN